MPDIPALNSEVQRLQSSTDWWTNATLYLTAITALIAVLYFVASRLAISKGAELRVAQDALAKANAQQLSDDLSAKDLKIAQANRQAEEAKERAANAQLELAKLTEPRSLSPERQERLISVLKPFAGQNFAFAVFPDPEPLALLRLLDTILKSAGWKRVPSQIEREGGVKVEAAGETAATIFDSGIDAYIAPGDTESALAQSAICSELRASGIHCETHRTPQLAGKAPRAITISIGKKP